MAKIQLLGIDPSFRNLGLARMTYNFDDCGIELLDLELIVTEADKGKTVRKSSDDLRRARLLVEAIERASKGCAFAVSEIPTGTQSARASWALGIAVGALASCPIPLIQVNPSEVKMAAVGKKTATKEQMIDWAYALYPDGDWLKTKRKGQYELTNANEHLADAVATVYAGVQTDQFAQATAMLSALQA